MGNESSTMVDDNTHPTTLKSRDLKSVAKYILEKDVRKIVVCVSDSLLFLADSMLTIPRPAQASAHLLEFRTSDPQTQAYTRI
jgi:hypothetical protein